MKTLNFLNINSTLFILITILSSGCNSNFSPDKSNLQNTSSAHAAELISNGDTVESSNLEQPQVYEDILTDLTKVHLNLDIPYGVFGPPLNTVLKEALNQFVRTKDCEKVGTAEDRRQPHLQYRCGEIPLGNIVDENKKFIYKVEIPSTWGHKDGTDYWTGSGNTQLYLSRHQRSGYINIDILDNKTGSQLVPTQTELGKDIFIKLAPKNGVLDSAVCFTIPGADITSNLLWIPGHISQSYLWSLIEINAKLSINIDLGYAKYDNVKSCVSVRIAYDKKSGMPIIDITGIENPVFQNLKLGGFKVWTDTSVSGFMGIVIDIMDFFGLGIKSIIADSVNKEVAKQYDTEVALTTEQVTSGEWILEMLQFEYLKPLLMDNINSALSKTRQTDGKKFEVEISKWMSAACLALLDKYETADQSDLTRNQLYAICSGIPEIQLNAFLDAPELEQEGCYSRFFSVDTLIKNPGTWWANLCKIKNEAVITTPNVLSPLFQCLSKSANNGFSNIKSCEIELTSIVNRLKAGEFDSYLKNSSIVDSYMNSSISIKEVEDLAKKYLGYSGKFSVDRNVLNYNVIVNEINPSMNLESIRASGIKNLTVMNIDVLNSKNLLNELIERKAKKTEPDIILLQNINSDTARKFIKDINYKNVVMGPAKTGYSNDAGIAILSKFDIIQKSHFSYGKHCLGSACDNNQGIIHARVKVDGVPHPVELVNTQFQSRQAAAAINLLNLLDYTQNKQLLDFFDYFNKNARSDLPLIVGGNFESDVNSRIYQQLLQALGARNGGKECADLSSCLSQDGTNLHELWFNSYDHHFIRNSNKIKLKPIAGKRSFNSGLDDNPISSGGALEITYQIEWKP